MNPRERLLATLSGGCADRVPLVLEGLHFASREEIEQDPDLAKREIAQRVFEHTHAEVECPSFVNRYLVIPPQAMRQVEHPAPGGIRTVTTEIDTPKGTLTAVTRTDSVTRTVWTVKYPVESLADLEAIRTVPGSSLKIWLLPTQARLPTWFANKGLLLTRISSPVVCVGGLMPYQYFLELCATEPDLMLELTEECQRRVLAVLDVLLAERSMEYVWLGGCEWLTPPMASPRLYELLVQPFETEIIARIHRAGALCHVHCHGRVRSSLERVIARGADFFEPVEPPPDGDISFAAAKALAAGRMTLGGNIEARILENQDEEAVEQAVRSAFEGGKRRMVLQSTAGVYGPMTPTMLRNYHRLVDLWEELSPL